MGRRTGPLTLSCLSLARLMRSLETRILSESSMIEKARLRTLLEVLDVAAGEGDPDLVDFSTGHWGTGSVVFLFTFGDVTHF